MSRAIVFGAAGQLGQCLQRLTKGNADSSIVYLPEDRANILDAESLKAIFEEHRPDYCINCAAYTAVDKAEDEPDVSRKVNRDGVENLARLCQEHGAALIHISTDFVFSGKGNAPLLETDAAEPVNLYGLTKLEGEQALQSITDRHFILRTSWLYSEYGNNFVKTMLRLAADRDELRVIWDQVGTPTYAVDLAACILHIVETGSEDYGLYHYSNEGLTSWYDLAKAIFELKGVAINVIPVRTSEYVTRAVRPAYTAMDKTKVKSTFNIQVPHWRDSLERCLEKL